MPPKHFGATARPWAGGREQGSLLLLSLLHDAVQFCVKVLQYVCVRICMHACMHACMHVAFRNLFVVYGMPAYALAHAH